MRDPDAIPDADPDAALDAVPDAGPDAILNATSDVPSHADRDAILDAVPDAIPYAETDTATYAPTYFSFIHGSAFISVCGLLHAVARDSRRDPTLAPHMRWGRGLCVDHSSSLRMSDPAIPRVRPSMLVHYTII